MKVSNKSDYNNIMRNASKVVKRLIESGAKYSEINRVVNEMASFTSGETIVPKEIRRNVEDVWNGNYKCDGRGENKVYLGCRYDVNHPDWVNLPKGKLSNILKGKFDKFGSVEEILALTYVAALRLCWSECPQTFDDAVDNDIMVNVIKKYMELGGDYDDIIDLYNKVGESSVSMDKYGTRGPRKSSDDGSAAASASADDTTPKRKRIKAQELPEEERYFDIDKETERVIYKEIPSLDGFDSLGDVMDVEPSEEDQRIAREAEERLANGDNDVRNDNTEDLPPEIAAEIARDEQQNNDLKPGEVVVATSVGDGEANPDAAEEIKQAEEEVEKQNADLTPSDDDDDVFKAEEDEPEAEEAPESEPEATSDDTDDDDVFKPEDDDDDVFKPEDDENDFPPYDSVETEPASKKEPEADYPAYDDVPVEDDDDVFQPEDDDEPFKPEDDDFDADLPKDTPDEENDDVFNSEDDDEADDDVFDPDAEFEDDEQPEEAPVQPKPQHAQAPRRNAIRQGNIMSGNLDEYANPAMNKFYAENYDDTFFTLNNVGEIGTDFEIIDVDTHSVLDTHTVYRATVDELFKLHTIGNDLDIEYGDLNIIIRMKNPILAKNVYNKYSNAQDEANKKWMNPLMDASIIISKMANNEQIFNTVDEVKTWLDDKGEIQILNDEVN